MNALQLECFLNVAKYMNYSKAADSISQPAVSYQIHSLKELHSKGCYRSLIL